jgi:hypothetical protein
LIGHRSVSLREGDSGSRAGTLTEKTTWGKTTCRRRCGLCGGLFWLFWGIKKERLFWGRPQKSLLRPKKVQSAPMAEGKNSEQHFSRRRPKLGILTFVIRMQHDKIGGVKQRRVLGRPESFTKPQSSCKTRRRGPQFPLRAASPNAFGTRQRPQKGSGGQHPQTDRAVSARN